MPNLALRRDGVLQARTAAVISGYPRRKPAFAPAAPGRCRHVGGGILTNFLDPNTCGGPTGLCSNGTATGDLNGTIGVSVLAVTGNVYHVQHHAVTETGVARRRTFHLPVWVEERTRT
jgi:hypothetical protein